MIGIVFCDIKGRIYDYLNRPKRRGDTYALWLGIAAIGFGLCVDGDSAMIWRVMNVVISIVAGIVGGLYIYVAINLYCKRRIEFDRMLAGGNYLRKVVTIVALLPSTLSLLLWFVGLFTPKDIPVADATKQDVVVMYSAEEGDVDISIVSPVVDKQASAMSNVDRSLPNIFRVVYYHYIDAGSQRGVNDGLSRVLVALFAILGVLLLNGLMVSTIIGWVDGRKDRWNRGVIHYAVKHLGERRFAVIIGANEMAAVVVRRLLGDDAESTDNRYVIIQTSRDPETVREELMSHLSDDHMRRIVIYQGLRDSMSEIEHLYLEWCNEVYILGEAVKNDGSDSSHDAMNMRCINLIASYLASHKWHNRDGEYGKLKCRAMFEYQTTYQMLQFADIPDAVKKNLDFMPFNRYESWARKVMVEGFAYNYMQEQRIDYTPLDGEGIAVDSNEHVHLVVVGMTKMGVAMGVQALLQAHYINYTYSESVGDRAGMQARRTRITFIDTKASQEMGFVKGHYDSLFNLVRHRSVRSGDKLDIDTGWIDPIMDNSEAYAHLCAEGSVYNFLDVEVEFIEGGLEDEHVRNYLTQISDNGNAWTKNSKLTIAMCQDDTTQASAGALYMPIEVYEKVQEVWVYQRESADIILNLKSAEAEDGRYKKLRPFGMLYGGYIDDYEYTKKAILVNSAYLDSLSEMVESYEKWTPARGEDLDRCMALYSEYRGNWDSCSMADKFSNYYFVDSISQKQRTMAIVMSKMRITEEAFDNKYGEAFARMEHNRWNIQQLIIGFSSCSKEVVAELKGAIDVCRGDVCAIKVAIAECKANMQRDIDRAKSEGCSAEDIQKIKDGYNENIEKLSARKRDYLKEWKRIRNMYRSGIRHQHPCICSFEHIDTVDVDAKDYDTSLNNAIPNILKLVGGLPLK